MAEDWFFDDEGCEFSGLMPDGTCGKPAVIEATVGCVHEHVFPKTRICQYHVEEVAAEDSYCAPCFEAGHDGCSLVVAPRSVRNLEVFGEVAHA